MPSKIYISYNPDNSDAKKVIEDLRKKFGNDIILLSESMAKEPEESKINALLDTIDDQLPDTALMVSLLDNSTLNNECFRYENLQGFLTGVPVIPINITKDAISLKNNPFTEIGVYFDDNGQDCFPMELLKEEWEQYELISNIDMGDPVHEEMRGKVYSLDIFLDTQNWEKNEDNVIKSIKDALAG